MQFLIIIFILAACLAYIGYKLYKALGHGNRGDMCCNGCDNCKKKRSYIDEDVEKSSGFH